MEVIEDREHVEMYAFFEFGRMPWPLYRTLGKVSEVRGRIGYDIKSCLGYLELQCRMYLVGKKRLPHCAAGATQPRRALTLDQALGSSDWTIILAAWKEKAVWRPSSRETWRMHP